jgi:SAM-dependent methyltransferase
MISDALLAKLACPVCLDEGGCARCARPGAGHAGCAEYAARAGCGCGGPEKRPLARDGDALGCACCGERYPIDAERGLVDLVPRAQVGELTQYADHEFHERLGVTDSPPVLSARVKADAMLRMLAPRDGEAVLDLGCGAGKLALYVAGGGRRTAGLDVAPFFLPRAAREIELVLGDLRRQPFRRGAFPCAYSLDVLEHLDEAGVRELLVEARRTVGGAGRLFVYTHAMESSRLASFQRWVNRLARRLGERGLIDHEREALRKSDHKNAIGSHEHFDALCAEAGFEVVERRYYNVVFKAVVEDLLLRLYERSRRGAGAGLSGPHAHAAHDAGSDPAARPATIGAPPPSRALVAVALALTWLLKLDLVLFGGIRTGPFFGLLRPTRP